MDSQLNAEYPEYTWSPPQYDISGVPCHESSLKLALDPKFPENFVRAAKWCPDGSQLLAQCENRAFQFFDAPPSESNNNDTPASTTSLRTLHQPSSILDFVWYPSATPTNPASYCFVASVRECPVKLLDASDGRLRASYRIVDHRERQIAPHSLAFNLSAEKLYCGFEDAVEVFDVARPGEGQRLPTTPSKKSKDGLKGIISALAFSPSFGSDLYAAGTLSSSPSNIAMFSESQGEIPIMFVSGGPRAGVTQLQFNPTKPHILYASHRRHGSIYSWDLRANVDAPVTIYNTSNPERTNQKLRFDVDLGGARLAVGDHGGTISVFDLDSSKGIDTVPDPYENAEEITPTLEFKAHEDAVGSVAFNPIRSILSSVSGSRHFQAAYDASDSSESSDELESGVVRRGERPHPVTLDASVKFWDFCSKNYTN